MGQLDGEVVLVTGGAQGIGAAIVAVAAEQGAAVSFCDVDAAGGERLASDLSAEGHRVVFRRTDVTDADEVDAWTAAATAAFGTPTGLVNNAGRNSYADPLTMTELEWDRFFDLDLKASWRCSRAVLGSMLAAGSGSIVNISSIHAVMTQRGMFPYAAAKSGLIGLTRSMALEVAPAGVRVNAVRPGLVMTPLAERHFRDHPDQLEPTLAAQPSGRPAAPTEIAKVVCFLLSADASFVNGADWAVDGAYSARFA